MIAALYVQKDGAYYGLPDVDPWDEERDARNYAGPHPVVAHPPCARWSIMGNCRPEYAKGDDGGCFAHALEAVREFGGVLEHPRYSLAWSHFGLPAPVVHGWARSMMDEGWATEVDQRLYGHNTRKHTWLYYVGDEPPPSLRWGTGDEGETSARGGRKGHGEHVSTHNNHHARSRTPVAFRDELLGMARGSVESSWGTARLCGLR